MITLEQHMLQLNMLVILVITTCFLKPFNMRKIILIKVTLMNKVLWMRINRFMVKEARVVLLLGTLVLLPRCKHLNLWFPVVERVTPLPLLGFD
jgi:hypothetical protein